MAALRGLGLFYVASVASASQAGSDPACTVRESATGEEGSCAAAVAVASPETTADAPTTAVSKDSVLLQVNRAALIQRHAQNTTAEQPEEDTDRRRDNCCDDCGGKAFCSPHSGNCYDTKNKDYYKSCSKATEPAEPTEPIDCCASCTIGVPGFCSPHSLNCYPSKRKKYYQSCPEGGEAEAPPPPRRLARAGSSENSIKFMSYNLFGWNAFNVKKWRSANVLKKIKGWGPAVYGAQEVETGGGRGYEHVKEKVVEATGLKEIGGSQFFDEGSMEKHEQEHFKLKRGYWMSMTRFTQKSTGQSFLFFNSHWKHGYGLEQAKIVANAVAEQRKKYGDLPTVLVGDTNQFCRAYEKPAIKYLKGEMGNSPVKFVDAIADDNGKSFTDSRNPDCRVDFILASEGQWELVDSYIDREGMGESGTASDHAALMAELVPVA